MASIHKTETGKYRVRWRDPAGRLKSKTFATRKEAVGFVAETQVALNRGVYIDPRAGKTRFGPYAQQWLDSRNDEVTTAARDSSIMRNHVLARWGDLPLMAIDHSSVQAWVTDLGSRLSPATVRECYRLTSNVFKAACRDRYLGFNPCDGVRLPRRRKKDTDEQTISQEAFVGQLLPAVADRYRALVAVAGGCGLRWGEVAGLRWDVVDLDVLELRVVRVDVEVSGHVSSKPYPKSKAGRRTVPIPEFVAEMLKVQRARYESDEAGRVFTNEVGGPLWRGSFRSRTWRPALVRAGMLGEVRQLAEREFRAAWTTSAGAEGTRLFRSEPGAVAHVARSCAGGLRFHDLRHSYATWLVSAGVPINDVAAVLGHEQTSTTLDRYTHSTTERFGRIRNAMSFRVTEDQDQT